MQTQVDYWLAFGVRSHLSFSDGPFADACSQHYHWLREYALEHAEAGAILAAID